MNPDICLFFSPLPPSLFQGLFQPIRTSFIQIFLSLSLSPPFLVSFTIFLPFSYLEYSCIFKISRWCRRKPSLKAFIVLLRYSCDFHFFKKRYKIRWISSCFKSLLFALLFGCKKNEPVGFISLLSSKWQWVVNSRENVWLLSIKRGSGEETKLLLIVLASFVSHNKELISEEVRQLSLGNM